MQRIQTTINSDYVILWVENKRSCLDFLRGDLVLTQSKHCSDVGACGTCSITVNDRPLSLVFVLPQPVTEVTSKPLKLWDVTMQPIRCRR